MSQERSAEWLRGAVESHINTCNLITSITSATKSHPARQGLMAAGNELHNQLDRYRALLAAAEAREATKLTKAQWIERYGGQAVLDREGFDVVPCVDCKDLICHGWMVKRRTEPTQPTAAEVIEAAEKALGRALTTRSFGTTFDLSSAATECTAALALLARWKEAK